MVVRDFHRLRVAAIERLCDDAVAVTFDVPDELASVYAPSDIGELGLVVDDRARHP